MQEKDEERLSYQRLSLRSGVPIPTLAGWRRQQRLRGEGGASFVELHARRASRSVSVPGASDAAPSTSVRIVLANGRRLEVDGGFDDAPLVARLVALLES